MSECMYRCCFAIFKKSISSNQFFVMFNDRFKTYSNASNDITLNNLAKLCGCIYCSLKDTGVSSNVSIPQNRELLNFRAIDIKNTWRKKKSSAKYWLPSILSFLRCNRTLLLVSEALKYVPTVKSQ